MKAKISILAAVLVLILSACGTEEKEKITDVGERRETAEEVIAENPEDVPEESEGHMEQTHSQEPEEKIAIEVVPPSDFDVADALGEAEEAAAALEKKLYEDASLTQADMNTLSYEVYLVWDDMLNDLWKALQESLDKEIMDGLLEEQRAWIAQKEAEVEAAASEMGGGSMAPLVANQRAAELTRARAYELAAWLGYEDDTITFVLEGMEEVVPATVFAGLNYTISIPAQGWEMIAKECWASEDNEEAYIWITDYAGEDVNIVRGRMLENGYKESESDADLWSREDEDGLVWNIKLFAEGGETIGVFYCYPKETEEGFGARLRTIADTFAWKTE